MMTTLHNDTTESTITLQPLFNVRMAVSAPVMVDEPTTEYTYLKGQWRPREWRIGFDGLQYNATRYEVAELIHTRNSSQVRTHYQKIKYKGKVNCFLLASVGIFVPQVVDEHDKAMMSLDHNGLPLPKCQGQFSTRETWLALRALFQWGLNPNKIAWCIGTRRIEDVAEVLHLLEALASAHGFMQSKRSERLKHKRRRVVDYRKTGTELEQDQVSKPSSLLQPISFINSVQYPPANPPPALFPSVNPLSELSWLV